MPLNSQLISDAPVIELESIDSTNNYAMRLIDADTAQAGLTVVAGEQTQGKGQRGRVWADEVGKSLLMSMVATPQVPLDAQFAFNATVSVAIADVLSKIYTDWDVSIKWPNDIIINDKKAGGILIENVIRGSRWSYAIIGLGLNVLQTEFNSSLPFATSLRIASGKVFELGRLLQAIRQAVLPAASAYINTHKALEAYNRYLYRRHQVQVFEQDGTEIEVIISHAAPDGKLHIQLQNGKMQGIAHGQYTWAWR